MSRISKISKYLIKDTARAIIVFYIVIAAIFVFGLLLPVLIPNSNVEFGGMKLATTIFLFVAGLNMFKSGYLFLQANSVTRRHFYLGGVLSFAAVAVLMTGIDVVLYAFAGIFTPIKQELSPQLYPGSGLAACVVWTLALNLLAIAVGWFITMLYYRSNKPLKLIISLSPAVLLIGLPLLDGALGLGLQDALGSAFLHAMGLAGTPNAYIGSFSMFLAAAFFAGLCFLLVRRAPVKEQDR